MVCRWWTNQKIVEQYSGVSKSLFNLQPYGSVEVEDYISVPGKSTQESALIAKILDAIKRVTDALGYAPYNKYFSKAQGNTILGYIKSAKNALKETSSIYTEWGNKQYAIMGVEEDFDPKKDWPPLINTNTYWPLDETLADNYYLYKLYSTRADVNEMFIDLRAGTGTWIKLWHTHGGPDSNQRTGKDVFFEHFENWPSKYLGTVAASRLGAIKSVRTAYKNAAHNARCAEVLVAQAISYGQNKDEYNRAHGREYADTGPGGEAGVQTVPWPSEMGHSKQPLTKYQTYPKEPG